MNEPKIRFGIKDHMTIECPFIKYASECQLNEGAINCDNCKMKKERVNQMNTEQEEFKGKCPNCGYAYKSEEDLVECKYNGNIWWLCPKCDKQI